MLRCRFCKIAFAPSPPFHSIDWILCNPCKQELNELRNDQINPGRRVELLHYHPETIPKLLNCLRSKHGYIWGRVLFELFRTSSNFTGLEREGINIVVLAPSLRRNASKNWDPLQLFADRVARNLNACFMDQYLVKGKVHRQHQLSRRKRRDATTFIQVNSRLYPNSTSANCRAALIDDIRTTGTTLLQCESELRNLGVDVRMKISLSQKPLTLH